MVLIDTGMDFGEDVNSYRILASYFEEVKERFFMELYLNAGNPMKLTFFSNEYFRISCRKVGYITHNYIIATNNEY